MFYRGFGFTSEPGLVGKPLNFGSQVEDQDTTDFERPSIG